MPVFTAARLTVPVLCIRIQFTEVSRAALPQVVHDAVVQALPQIGVRVGDRRHERSLPGSFDDIGNLLRRVAELGRVKLHAELSEVTGDFFPYRQILVGAKGVPRA